MKSSSNLFGLVKAAAGFTPGFSAQSFTPSPSAPSLYDSSLKWRPIVPEKAPTNPRYDDWKSSREKIRLGMIRRGFPGDHARIVADTVAPTGDVKSKFPNTELYRKNNLAGKPYNNELGPEMYYDPTHRDRALDGPFFTLAPSNVRWEVVTRDEADLQDKMMKADRKYHESTNHMFDPGYSYGPGPQGKPLPPFPKIYK